MFVFAWRFYRGKQDWIVHRLRLTSVRKQPSAMSREDILSRIPKKAFARAQMIIDKRRSWV